MSLRHFHHHDGRSVSIDRKALILIEDHESGEGTSVRVGPLERPIDMHLREDYASVMKELSRSDWDISAENFVEGDVPFG